MYLKFLLVDKTGKVVDNSEVSRVLVDGPAMLCAGASVDKGMGEFDLSIWYIGNCTLRNKLQWNFNRNLNLLIQEYAFENVICEMAAILSRPHCVKVPSLFHAECCYVARGIFVYDECKKLVDDSNVVFDICNQMCVCLVKRGLDILSVQHVPQSCW